MRFVSTEKNYSHRLACILLLIVLTILGSAIVVVEQARVLMSDRLHGAMAAHAKYASTRSGTGIPTPRPQHRPYEVMHYYLIDLWSRTGSFLQFSFNRSAIIIL